MKELARCSKILALEKLKIPSPTLGTNFGSHGMTPPCRLTLSSKNFTMRRTG